jgi:hypothetical protein
MKLTQLAEAVQPNVTNDILAGGAVAYSWTSEIHEWLSITVTVMAAIYYLWGFYLFLRDRHHIKKKKKFYVLSETKPKRGHDDPD